MEIAIGALSLLLTGVGVVIAYLQLQAQRREPKPGAAPRPPERRKDGVVTTKRKPLDEEEAAWPDKTKFGLGAGLGIAGLGLLGFVALCCMGIALSGRQGQDPLKSAPPQGVQNSAPLSSQSAQTANAGNAPRLSSESAQPAKARIEGVAYSRSKGVWAFRDSIFGGLRFSMLTGSGNLKWKESYTVSPSQITLAINDLRLPGKLIWVDERDCWADIDVGYYVELKNAVFNDHTIAKTFLIYKTFASDTPPKKIEKQFGIRIVQASDACDHKIGGEWAGSYVSGGTRCFFVMRLVQSGNSLSGAAIEVSPKEKARCTLDGWIVDGHLTLLKRRGGKSLGVSYVSSSITSSSAISGKWSSYNKAGEWTALFKGKFDGSVHDLPTSIPNELGVTGTLRIENARPVGLGVNAQVEVDGKVMKKWPVGTSTIEVTAEVGTRTIAVRAFRRGLDPVDGRVIETFIVKIEPGKTVVHKMDK